MATTGRKRRTDVWTHFFYDSIENKTHCIVCRGTITGKNTTNLKRHLLKNHSEICNVSLLKVAGAAHHQEDEGRVHVKTEPCSLPIVSSSFNVEFCHPNCPDVEVPQEQRVQCAMDADTMPVNPPCSVRDEDELFLLSLLPSLKRLNQKKRMEVRMEFQKVLYAAEYQN